MRFTITILLSALLAITTTPVLSQPVSKAECYQSLSYRRGVFQAGTSRTNVIRARTFAAVAKPICANIEQCLGKTWRSQCELQVRYIPEAKGISNAELAQRFDSWLGLIYQWQTVRAPFAEAGLIREDPHF
ncbi:MAG: hypothetical protein M1816_004972 [Peltula sp. TS41687]|nr:MAG: hypothetical protein M1816_004972 [Peltula sp. TS41687]